MQRGLIKPPLRSSNTLSSCNLRLYQHHLNSPHLIYDHAAREGQWQFSDRTEVLPAAVPQGHSSGRGVCPAAGRGQAKLRAPCTGCWSTASEGQGQNLSSLVLTGAQSSRVKVMGMGQ